MQSVNMVNIYPGKLTFFCQYPEKTSTMIDISGLRHPDPDGVVSQKANKRIRNAIDWLLHLSSDKEVLYKNSKKKFDFKINFLTLTLPSFQIKGYQYPCGKVIETSDIVPFIPAVNIGFGKFVFKTFEDKKGITQVLTDNWIKSNLLNQFLTELRGQFKVTHYVWRAESQQNGNIHFHITTNRFIYWKKLRTIWNRILDKSCLINDYEKKFKGLTFNEYCSIADPHGNKSTKKLAKAYQYGISTDWRDPNTVDIHSVRKVRNISVYMGKYFSKDDEAGRHITGKLWRLSQSLSKLKCIAVEISLSMQSEIDFLKKKFKSSYRTYEHASILYTDIKDIFKSIKNSKLISTFRYYRDFMLNLPSFDFPKNEYLYILCNYQLNQRKGLKLTDDNFLFNSEKLAIPISDMFPKKNKQLQLNFG